MRLFFLLFLFAMDAMAAQFEITSTRFRNNEKIPTQFSCDGQDISPPLAWRNAPVSTQSFALICSDPDAPNGTWYHWVVFNIPKTLTEIADNQPPKDSVLGKNSWGRMRYNGPCPPPGTAHRYIFTLYALDTRLNLPASTDAETLQETLQGHLLEKTSLVGLFGR